MVNKCNWSINVICCLVLILATCISCHGHENENCKQHCKCYWGSGKSIADCTDRNFYSLPFNITDGWNQLDLARNHISKLENNIFNLTGLVDLHYITLRDNQIQTIEPNAFNFMNILIEIDLSGNLIRRLHPHTFNSTHRLKVLNLSSNKLEQLPSYLFHNLTLLQRVFLSNNQLKVIEDRTFVLLEKFQGLHLSNNSLSTLNPEIYQDVRRGSTMDLRDNPWNCDCQLRKFRDWALEMKHYTHPTTCLLPHSLANKTWASINSEDFACLPKFVYLQPRNLLIDRGDDATLYCRALGSPRPQVYWTHHSQVLTNNTTRKRKELDRFGSFGYVVSQGNGWVNLTVPQISSSDKGEYVCVAKNNAGQVQRNVSLEVLGEISGRSGTSLGLPLAIALGVIIFVLIILTLALYLYYCKKKKSVLHEKGSETTVPLDHHGMNELEKSLDVNPVLKPTNKRYDNQPPASFRGEITELNRTLLDSDSIYADGVSAGGGSAGALINNGIHLNGSIVNGTSLGGSVDQVNEDRGHLIGRTPDLDIGEPNILPSESITYRQYPPDLLAFPGRGVSPTSQASTAPDNSRLPAQFGITPNPSYTKTLPHNRSGASYMSSMMSPTLVLPRYGYVTIPRRPRASPSWGTSSPLVASQSMSASTDLIEPIYDNLGRRTTADGSIKQNLADSILATRPLPATPTIREHFNNSGAPERAAPEGAAEWPNDFSDEQCIPEINFTSSPNPATIQKIPPRPPPKPKKKTANGPLYEDEDEDGTEV